MISIKVNLNSFFLYIWRSILQRDVMLLFIWKRDPLHADSVGICSIEYPWKFILLVLAAWVFKRVSVMADCGTNVWKSSKWYES